MKGDHLDAETTFDFVAIGTDFLADWTGRHGHSVESMPTGVTVTADTSTVLLASSTSARSLELVESSSFLNRPYRVVVEGEVTWEAKLQTPVTWRDAIETIVWPLQDFATFCTGSRTGLSG